MLYKIDRELVAINKENRLIPTGRKTRKLHNRSVQIPSSRIDTRKMSFYPRTVRDWNLLAPDIVELDTPEAFKAIEFTIKTIYSCHCLDYRDTILALKASGVSNSTMSGASRFQSRTVLG
jgi:hypothetical protein